MNKKQAEQILNEFLKPIFGFALKRCKNIQDAEDLSQEIVSRAYTTLVTRDDIVNINSFIWTIAHNTLCNYYRNAAKQYVCINIDDAREMEINSDVRYDVERQEELALLHKQIAFLSKTQRKIVVGYYFEQKKQSELAKELGLSVGTVKWHLFDAKQELKRGIEKMQETNTLKFNPIQFSSYGATGSIVTETPRSYLRSLLAQNICYCVRSTAKTVNEIASDLGVSPVYVENEVEHLEKYALLISDKGKYIVNFVINCDTQELLSLKDNMYTQASKLFANELYDNLVNSKILDNVNICQNLEQKHRTQNGQKDYNLILWALIPYIAAFSGEKLMDKSISFKEVSTVRPDGASNIFSASITPSDVIVPEALLQMKNFSGPMWNESKNTMLWQIYTPWSEKQRMENGYSQDAHRIISLYREEQSLSTDDCAWLAERGFVTIEKTNDTRHVVWQPVILKNSDINKKLITLGDTIKEKYNNEFERLKKPFVEMELATLPPHLRKMKAFEQQFIFYADSLFLLYCLKTLVDNGKLKLPTVQQQKILTTIIVNTND